MSPAVILRGKITIPRQWKHTDGKTYDVLILKDFKGGDGAKGEKVTHVFMERPEGVTSTAPLLTVANNCFQNNTSLKYFDFGGTSLRHIGQTAFNKCTSLDFSLIDLTISTLRQIGYGAFNNAGDDSKTADIVLSSSIQHVAPNGLLGLKLGSNSSLTIGSKAKPSVLNLAKGVSALNQRRKFSSPGWSSITIYSNAYVGDTVVTTLNDGTELSVCDFFTDKMNDSTGISFSFNP